MNNIVGDVDSILGEEDVFEVGPSETLWLRGKHVLYYRLQRRGEKGGKKNVYNISCWQVV